MQVDLLWTYLQEHFQEVLISVGVIVFVGAIRDWKWLTTPTLGERSRLAFLFMWWRNYGYRIFVGSVGLLLCGSGLFMLAMK